MALPAEVMHSSLTVLQEKLVKIGAKVLLHGRYVAFQSAEIAMSLKLIWDFSGGPTSKLASCFDWWRTTLQNLVGKPVVSATVIWEKLI